MSDLKVEWLKKVENKHTKQCKNCGRFVNVFTEYNGKKTLYCAHCDTSMTFSYLSYRNINRSKNFIAVWFKTFKNDSVHTIENFKELVNPIHSFEYYTKKTIRGNSLKNSDVI